MQPSSTQVQLQQMHLGKYLPVNKFSYRNSVVSRLLKRNLTLLLTPTDIRAYASRYIFVYTLIAVYTNWNAKRSSYLHSILCNPTSKSVISVVARSTLYIRGCDASAPKHERRFDFRTRTLN